MGFRVIIPARYASQRLPGKPLRSIAGRPMIQHVWEQARQSGADQVVVATDDSRIAEAVAGFGGEVCLTATSHRSGTERLAEAARSIGCKGGEVVVNLQGDEPLMPPALIAQVANALAQRPEVPLATLCTPIAHVHDLFDRNVVKLVRDAEDCALYFSRAPIPWHRDEFAVQTDCLPEDGTPFMRHIGLYAYRADFLAEYVAWPPSPLEAAESLEQLRVLWHGRRILAEVAETVPGPGVDSEDDLQRVESLLRAAAS